MWPWPQIFCYLNLLLNLFPFSTLEWPILTWHWSELFSLHDLDLCFFLRDPWPISLFPYLIFSFLGLRRETSFRTQSKTYPIRWELILYIKIKIKLPMKVIFARKERLHFSQLMPTSIPYKTTFYFKMLTNKFMNWKFLHTVPLTCQQIHKRQKCFSFRDFCCRIFIY